MDSLKIVSIKYWSSKTAENWSGNDTIIIETDLHEPGYAFPVCLPISCEETRGIDWLLKHFDPKKVQLSRNYDCKTLDEWLKKHS
jgi:hypothetical protein